MEQKDLPEPVIFNARPTNNEAKRANVHGQTLILKALSEGVTDIDELKKLTGMKTAAGVIASIDKIALRKGYHEALARAGITLDTVAQKFAELMRSDNERIALNSVKALTQSLGLESFRDEAAQEKSWEDVLREIASKSHDAPQVTQGAMYEFKAPEMPQSVREKMERDAEDGDNLRSQK